MEEDNNVDEHVEDNGNDMGYFTKNNNIMMKKFCECYINDVMVKKHAFWGLWNLGKMFDCNNGCGSRVKGGSIGHVRGR